ncbi:MAG TPA: YHS domain-containing protein, partial [Usitatibacter sp.]
MDHSHHPGHANPDAAPKSAVDPICGMTVAADSPRRFDFGGTTYLFCGDHCLKKFSADPGKYVGKPSPSAHEDDAASRGHETASAD